MADPILSYERVTYGRPDPEKPLGPGGEIAAPESFTDSTNTFVGFKMSPETHWGRIRFTGIAAMGSCTCPDTPPTEPGYGTYTFKRR